MRSKIIHIINHPPAYEEYADKPKPAINWDTQDGKWVGIWGYDWANQIANEVLKVTDEFEHEVWQPDLRADKVYSHTFDDGLTHRLFPASMKKKVYGIKRHCAIFSAAIIEEIDKISSDKRNIILQLGHDLTEGITEKIVKSYPKVKKIVTYHGAISLPINRFYSFQKNILAKPFQLFDHFKLKAYFGKIDYVTYMNDTNLSILKKYYYNGPTSKITMGVDFEKFQPIAKEKCRVELGLPLDKKIFLTVSRLYPLKQIDILLKLLSRLSYRFDFQVLIAGHGTRDYEEYLKQIVNSFKNPEMVKFFGYKRGEELTKIINTADLFFNVSKSEGSPMSVVEAMACNIPVFTTNVGNCAEVLHKYAAGCIVNVFNYKQWEDNIVAYLQGKRVKAFNLDIVKEHYSWQNIAQKFLDVYREVQNKNNSASLRNDQN